MPWRQKILGSIVRPWWLDLLNRSNAKIVRWWCDWLVDGEIDLPLSLHSCSFLTDFWSWKSRYWSRSRISGKNRAKDVRKAWTTGLGLGNPFWKVGQLWSCLGGRFRAGAGKALGYPKDDDGRRSGDPHRRDTVCSGVQLSTAWVSISNQATSTSTVIWSISEFGHRSMAISTTTIRYSSSD